MRMRNLTQAVAIVAIGLSQAQAKGGQAVQEGDKGPAAAAVAPAGSGQVGRTLGEPIVLAPGDLTWKAAPAVLPPGAQMAVIEGDPAAPDALFTLRAKLPANYKIPPHFHPADEHVTVLSGTFAVGHGEQFDAAKARDLPAGGFFVMPAKHPHFALTRTETIIQVHAVGPWGLTYVNPADDPRGRGVGGAGSTGEKGQE